MAEQSRRQSLASVALIHRRLNGRTEWLARWNRNWRCYYFVGGHKRDGETFLDCLVREIREELGIEQDRDYQVTSEPLARLEYTAYSRSAKADTDYTLELYDVRPQTEYKLELFDVRLADALHHGKLDSEQTVRWLLEEEIRAGQCSDGRPVSETMLRVLDQIGWEIPRDR